jgi:LDH2 family malate/lactate/ureidoglycolate dehydrogenase
MEQQSERIRVQSQAFQEFANKLYQRAGVPKADADAVAKMQVETDQRGVYSHGTRALPGYARGVMKGEINPTPKPRILTDAPSAALVDADNALGHVAGKYAMRLAIEKAHKTGVAAVAVRNSNHYGAAACFAMMALPEGMIGFTTTKTGGASVVPYGGVSGLLGNHPMAYAIPTQDEPPIVLDMAVGMAAWGKVGVYGMEGKQLPLNWVLDAAGNPTQDPRQARGMLPFGGYKGHGLAIAMSLLSGVLTGGPAACNVTADTPPELARRGHFFYAVKISNFCPLNEFTEAVDREIRTIRNAKRAEGVDRIYLPGEIEWLNQQDALKNGVSLHRKHLEMLAGLAKELGVNVFWESSRG